VSRIVGDARRRSTHLLTENRAALDMLAGALLERESIEGKDVHRILEVARAGGSIAEVFPEPEPAPPVAPEPAPLGQVALTDKPQSTGIVPPPPMAPGVAPT